MNAQIVFNQEKMDFRYGSGTTIFTERFCGGRLLSRAITGAGMPPTGNAIMRTAETFRLVVDGQDATYGLTFEDFSHGEAPDGRLVSDLRLANERLSLGIRIRMLMGENGFFTRKLYVENRGTKPISITSVSPLSGSLMEIKHDTKDHLGNYDAPPYRVGYFKDVLWGCEGNFTWSDVPFNTTLSIGSETGESGHTHPFAIVEDRVMGGMFVVQMEWGANWCFQFANNFYHAADRSSKAYARLRYAISPDAPAPMRVIAVGEEVEAPAVHFGYLHTDLDGAVQALHEYQRKYLLARPAGGYDPVEHNHWGYTEHRMTEKGLLEEVERAAAYGAELFVVDAGWYGRAEGDWFGTVGDWQKCRLEKDLYPVIDRAHALGLKFGLWVEPEAVGEDSELLREHPEWVMERFGERVERSLDLSRPEVEAYVEGQLINLIERYKPDLLRLDYNNERVDAGGFNERDGYMENTHWRHVEAIHRIFDHIREKFPTLLLENCASGGGRTDLGMMSRFSKTQISDWFMFPRIARTFNGMSMCLPPEALMMVSGWIMRASRYGGAEAHLQTTIQGVPQLSGGAPAGEPLQPGYLALLKKYVGIYKSFVRPIQSRVRVFHHTPVVEGFSGEGWVVNEAMLPDGTRGYANLVRLPHAKSDTWRLYLRGIDIGKTYRVTCLTGEMSAVVDGYTLYSEGFPVRLENSLLSQMLLLEALD